MTSDASQPPIDPLAGDVDRYSALVQNATDLVSICDAEGVVRYVSPSVQRMLGYDPAAMIGRSSFDFLHPDDMGLIVASFGQIVVGAQSPPTVRLRFRHADGGYRVLEASSTNLIDNPAVRGVVVNARDVTASMAAEQALRESEARYRNLVDLSPTLIIVSSLDEGRIRLCNAASARIFGYDDPAALVGLLMDSFIVGDLVPQATRRRDDLRRGAALGLARYQIRGHDGALRTIEVGSTLITSQGEQQALTVGHDITARIDAERMLSFKARVLAQVDDAVIATDSDGQISYMNESAERRYGVALAAARGAPLHSLFVHEALDVGAPAEVAAPVGPDGVWRGEAVHRLRDGRRIIVELTISPLRDEDGAAGGMLTVVRDITARKQAAERLRLLESVVVHANDAVLIIDAEPGAAPGPYIRYANAACSRLTGYAAYELVGRSLRILHGPATDPAAAAAVGSAIATRRAARTEITHYTRDGRPIWVELSLSPVADESGRTTHFIALQRDIGAQKLAGLLEHDRAATLAMLLRSAPVDRVLGQLVGLVERQRPDLLVWVGIDPLTSAASAALAADAADLGAAIIPRTQAAGTRQAPLVIDLARRARWAAAREHGMATGWVWPLGAEGGALAIFSPQIGPPQEADISLMRMVADLLALLADHVRLNESLRYQARYDTLTGLPNRHLLQERIELALRDARDHRGQVALLFIDLDGFKQVNDSLGHPTGDRFLKHVSQAFAACVRPQDTLGRMGGDEFLLLMPDLPDARLAEIAAQRLLDALRTPYLDESQELSLTASIGISLFPQDGADGVSLLKNADSALHRAKEAGRSVYIHYQPEHSRRARDRLDLEAQLRRALERGELTLHYQPQYDLMGDVVTGVEALLRWHHPQRGQISPAAFIPIAEESILIVEIGSWVLRAACQQAVAWQLAGRPPLRVSVNVSARQLLRPEFVAEVAAALAASGLAAGLLELEITEGVMLDDPLHAASQIDQLHQMGVRIALDDFGTGYSSLAYLRQLRLDALKIDRAFVRAIDEPTDLVSNGRALLRAMINLAHSLGLAVIAEGVETAEQRAALISMGCDFLQGYLISRPQPADALWQVIEQL